MLRNTIIVGLFFALFTQAQASDIKAPADAYKASLIRFIQAPNIWELPVAKEVWPFIYLGRDFPVVPTANPPSEKNLRQFEREIPLSKRLYGQSISTVIAPGVVFLGGILLGGEFAGAIVDHYHFILWQKLALGAGLAAGLVPLFKVSSSIARKLEARDKEIRRFWKEEFPQQIAPRTAFYETRVNELVAELNQRIETFLKAADYQQIENLAVKREKEFAAIRIIITEAGETLSRYADDLVKPYFSGDDKFPQLPADVLNEFKISLGKRHNQILKDLENLKKAVAIEELRKSFLYADKVSVFFNSAKPFAFSCAESLHRLKIAFQDKAI